MPDSADAVLASLGFEAFRPGQRETIDTLLAAGRALLVAPTGGGKSLCYQVPALMLEGTTLVISPLVALMADQVAALQSRGVAATYLAATLPEEELGRRLAGLWRGEYRLVYVAPERLASAGFRARLQQLDCPLIAVDEAHCISEWGHDFRPDYLQIGELVQALAPRHVLACTATATPVVRDEIINRLGLPPDTPQILRGFARPNLALRAVEAAGGRARQKQIDATLEEALGAPRAGRGVAIVYTPSRRLAETEAGRLAGLGWRAAAYHAGLPNEDRRLAQQDFMAGKLDVICATNAFGMGIDRADVRAVIHYGPPGSIEAYYQEVGRAGRDGDDAIGVMCWSQADLPQKRRLIERDGETAPDVVEHKWQLFLELIRWAEGGSCRHDAILRYFGDEAETLSGCGRCDVCTRIDEGDSGQDATLRARQLLSAVARVHNRLGMKMAVALLRGESDPRLQRQGLERTPTFGLLRARPADWLTRALGRCVTAGWVSFSGDDYPLLQLTAEGRSVMKGERPARWLPPPEQPPASGARRSRGSAPKAAAPADEAPLDAAAQAAFEALRATRMELAKAAGVPAYVIAHDRTLREIARLRPVGLDALQEVPGLGPAKIERYGEALLAALDAA